jgi:hypothetical protein
MFADETTGTREDPGEVDARTSVGPAFLVIQPAEVALEERSEFDPVRTIELPR